MNSREALRKLLESLEQAVPSDQGEVDTVFDPDKPDRARILGRFMEDVYWIKRRIRARLVKWAREDEP